MPETFRMITVFGSTVLDQIGAVPRLPARGETVVGGSFTVAAGGKGANQALAACRAGRRVRFISAVGDDPFGTQALALLRKDGVDLELVKTVKEPTGIGMIVVDSGGENAIAVLPGANRAVSESDAERALDGMRAGSILMMQEEIPAESNRRALELARKRGVRTLFNTAPFLDTTTELAKQASIVIANEVEFGALCHTSGASLDEAMQDHARANGQIVIVTLGPGGARAATGTEIIHAPAAAILAVDTVGAGDTFCGYLAAGLDAGESLEAAMQRATIAASLTCLKRGAQPAIPWSKDVDVFAASLTP